MNYPAKIDLHMHSTVSDGTDTPEQILINVKAAGIQLFALTDHDDIKGCRVIQSLLKEDDPLFICGVEFSCKDELGQYHILGYQYHADAQPIRDVVRLGHSYRINKVKARLDFLEREYHFAFPQEELEKLFQMDNPGKPHIGNLMVKYGYANTKEEAIKEYINRIHFRQDYVRPEEAIEGILLSGGIPVLAHPSYGSGDQIIVGEEMNERLQHLISFGLQGVECFYSGFTQRLQNEMLGFAKQYNLYVTAGSDYHGTNKLIALGDNHLPDLDDYPDGLIRFLDRICVRKS